MEDTTNETQLQGDDNSLIVKSERMEESVRNEIDNQRKCSSWYAKISLTIEPAIFSVFLAANLCDVVITSMIMDRTCQVELHLNKSECSLLGNDSTEGHKVEALVQHYVSVLLTGKSLISSIIPALLSLYLGPWSDVNGRKFLLLSPMLGLSMSFLLYAVFSYFSHLKPAHFLLASLPFSFSGGYINLVSAAYTYITDTSIEENRALRLGLLEASLFTGILIGMISSYRIYSIDTRFGYIITLSIGALISLVAFLYTMFFVKESIGHREVSQNEKGLFQLKFVKETFIAIFKKRENQKRGLICLSLITMIVTIVIMEGETNLMYLFTRLRFGWSFPQFTTWSSVLIASRFVGLIIGCVLFTKIFKMPDNVLLLISFFMKFIECAVYGFIPSNYSYLMYWAQLIGILGGVAGPALRSILSKLVPQEDIGKVFFLATSFESLFPLAFTPIYTGLYNLTIKMFPGAFLLLSASLYMCNFILCCVIYLLQKRMTNVNYSLLANGKRNKNNRTVVSLPDDCI